MANLELKTLSGGSVTLVPEDGVSNVTATVKHESGVLASEFDAGVGRTWQDVTASRATGVTYTNNTGREIILSVNGIVSISSSVRTNVNGLVIVGGNSGAGSRAHSYRVIPSGATYSFDFSGVSGSSLLIHEFK